MSDKVAQQYVMATLNEFDRMEAELVGLVRGVKGQFVEACGDGSELNPSKLTAVIPNLEDFAGSVVHKLKQSCNGIADGVRDHRSRLHLMELYAKFLECHWYGEEFDVIKPQQQYLKVLPAGSQEWAACMHALFAKLKEVVDIKEMLHHKNTEACEKIFLYAFASYCSESDLYEAAVKLLNRLVVNEPNSTADYLMKNMSFNYFPTLCSGSVVVPL